MEKLYEVTCTHKGIKYWSLAEAESKADAINIGQNRVPFGSDWEATLIAVDGVRVESEEAEHTGVYDFTISGISADGYQYYCGMLEPERLDKQGQRTGKAFSLDVYHANEVSFLYLFSWIGGTPRNYKQIAKFKEEIISPAEVSDILKKYNLVEVETND